jgi:serine/threonine protein kinase
VGREAQPEQPGWGLPGLAPGMVVAGYRVEWRIGAGGMAMVFRARDESLGRTVALKVLAPALADDAAFRERFIRESRAAAVVDHPHIIPVYGAGEFEGVLYIAMRYVAGGDLRALLQREGPLPPSRAAFLLSPLASALDAGHAAGLVHRDVKPANVLIDTSPGRPDHLYLSDFGLAKGSASTGLTGTGQFLGTLEYCAPEQIGGKPARPQTDQYALGCVAYTMFTGAVPFPRDEVTAVLWAHMSEPPPPVTALRPDLPSAVDPVLARAMAKDPDERYPTCAEFADAVRAALGLSAYTTPSSIYTTAGTDLSLAREGGTASPAAAITPVPVPPSALSVPPAAPDPVPPPRAEPVPGSPTPGPVLAPPPREEAVSGSPAATHAPTQSGSSLGFADTTGQTIAAPGSSPAPVTSPRQAVSPARRRGVFAAAAIVVATGGVTVAVLALSSHNSPPAPAVSSPPLTTASSPPATTASSPLATAVATSPPPLATLTEPDGAPPTGVAFTSDGTLVTLDAADAYSWDIATGRPTRTDFESAKVLTSTAVSIEDGVSLRAGSQGNVIQVLNGATGVVQVLNAATGKVVATLAAPSRTAVNAATLSPDGTEAALADSNGHIYVWHIAG